MYTHTSQQLNTSNNQNIFWEGVSFPIENLNSENVIDLNILEAEFLEVKENPIRVIKDIPESAISSKQSFNKVNETISEIIKTISGSLFKRTEIQAKETIRLSDLFIYRDFWAVKNYLNRNGQLRELLFETHYKLKNYFGNSAQFILELVPDIYEPNFEQLYIRVISNQVITKSLEILDNFENDWWFERTAYFINSPVILIK